MSASSSSRISRRRFLGQANCALISSIPVVSTLFNLRMAGSVAAQSGGPGYRALVCVFLSGGIDSFNLLSPWSGPSPTSADAFNEYRTSRGDLALTHAQQIRITPDNTPGRTFGVHSGAPFLASRFASGQAAFVANVGTLIEPVTDRGQVFAATRRLPLGLYSHSDQAEQWQTGIPHSRSGTGWAGRIMDLIRSLNTDPRVPMNISLDGSNPWQTGVSGAEYAVSAGYEQSPEGGAIPLTGYALGYDSSPFTNAVSTAIDGQLAGTWNNLLQQTWQKQRRDSQEAYAVYTAATSAPLPGSVAWPNTVPGRQLKQVAKTIMGRSLMGANRQTFFVNCGGWDHHQDTLLNQSLMIPELDAALSAFWQQLELLGVTNEVTLFSASDFGRTLTSNGRGSDHAWGGNAFVLGGAVKGRNICGQYPGLALNSGSTAPNPLDTGRGRFIPTTSCDVYFAELALWLGVPRSSLPLILPNIGNFISTAGTAPPAGFLL